MFQKSQEKSTEVAIQLADGTQIGGELVCGLTGTIDNALNREGGFVEITDSSGHPRFIAKRQIAIIEPANRKPMPEPKLKPATVIANDWANILGVSEQASPTEVRTAYHALVKQYHPDAFGENTPKEVLKYASDMLTRINVAYETFEAIAQAA